MNFISVLYSQRYLSHLMLHPDRNLTEWEPTPRPTCRSVMCKYHISGTSTWYKRLRITVGMTTGEEWNELSRDASKVEQTKQKSTSVFSAGTDSSTSIDTQKQVSDHGMSCPRGGESGCALQASTWCVWRVFQQHDRRVRRAGNLTLNDRPLVRPGGVTESWSLDWVFVPRDSARRTPNPSAWPRDL